MSYWNTNQKYSGDGLQGADRKAESRSAAAMPEDDAGSMDITDGIQIDHVFETGPPTASDVDSAEFVSAVVHASSALGLAKRVVEEASRVVEMKSSGIDTAKATASLVGVDASVAIRVGYEAIDAITTRAPINRIEGLVGAAKVTKEWYERAEELAAKKMQPEPLSNSAQIVGESTNEEMVDIVLFEGVWKEVVTAWEHVKSIWDWGAEDQFTETGFLDRNEKPNSRKLEIVIDPGDAPQELLEDILMLIDALNRAEGGSGIRYVNEGLFVGYGAGAAG